MSLHATVHKVQLEVSDLDRPHYHSYSLTLAKHPSETDERVMVRLVVFALNAHERLEFGSDLSSTEEPALWQKDLTGAVERWIELGQPAVKVLRKACSRAASVRLYVYGRGSDVWWPRIRDDLLRFEALEVFRVDGDLAGLFGRTMTLHALVQDGQLRLSNDVSTVEVSVETLKGPLKAR